MKNICILSLIFLAACTKPYAGFKEIETGFYFKWKELGVETSSLKKSDFLLIGYDFCKDSDCDSARYSRQLFINLSDSFINRQFWSGFHIGDRFTLIFEEKALAFKKIFSIPDSISIRFPVIVTCESKAFCSFNHYTGDSSYLESLLDFREREIIDSWVSQEPGYMLDDSGIYVKVIEAGSGDSVAMDREVVLSYKAYFFNGALFDNTDNWQDTFKYVVGVPNQVISGISAGIDGLRKGGKAKIIIPSRFAFGKNGSSTGLVPPFEPLKYEIKIIDVNVK